MVPMTDDRTQLEPAIPDDLRPVAESLDRLARADADTARAGFELRLAHATRPVLVGAVRHARPRHRHRFVATRRARGLLALTACVAFAAITLAIWLTPRATVVPAAVMDEGVSLASDVDLLISLTTYEPGFSDRFSAAVADTIALEAEVESAVEPWSVIDDGGSL
jgi:hypothetical protein